MATIVLFDDDACTLRRTRELVEQEAPYDSSRSIHEATTLDELLAIMSSVQHVDILVSDIMMGEGKPSGIDVVQKLFPASSGTQVIYVSGYLSQAPEVYRTNHVYFLLKPIDPNKLRDALQRAYASLGSTASLGSSRMLRISVGHRDHLINPRAIQYLESELHKVHVHCGKDVYTTYAKLDDLQLQLPSTFVRCHRSILVNLAYVSSLDERDVRLRDGTVLPVSRRKARDVQRSLLAFVAGRQDAS